MAAALSPLRNRWLQLALAVLAMICIANLQYGWTLFVNPLSTEFGWTKTAIQSAFFFFVLFETWIVPFNGWFADKYGPKPMVFLAGVLVAAGWIVNAHATTVGGLLTGEILSGIGAGLVYGTMVGIAVKWFPDRRGLAVGLTAAGFGAGAAITVIPIANMIKAAGPGPTFQIFGVIQGVIVLLISLVLVFPRPGEVAVVTDETGALSRQRKNSYTPAQMLTSPAFYLLYVMMVMIATGLLFVTAAVAPMGKDYGITAAIVSLALVVDNLTNGGSRILFGWLSDRLGREVTMAIAFTCEALGLLLLIFAAHSPVLFVIAAAATFLASGEIYSLFPASCTDLFGPKYATTNSGLLYTAKGTAALVVPLATQYHAVSGTWSPVLAVLVAFNVIVAALAVAVLKPMRERAVAEERALSGRTAAAQL